MIFRAIVWLYELVPTVSVPELTVPRLVKVRVVVGVIDRFFEYDENVTVSGLHRPHVPLVSAS